MIERICAVVFLSLISIHPADSCAAVFQSEEVPSGITVKPVTGAHLVLGADERMHIPYELEIVNQSGILVTVERVEVLDDAGRKLDEVTGELLAARIRISGGESGKNIRAIALGLSFYGRFPTQRFPHTQPHESSVFHYTTIEGQTRR